MLREMRGRRAAGLVTGGLLADPLGLDGIEASLGLDGLAAGLDLGLGPIAPLGFAPSEPDLGASTASSAVGATGFRFPCGLSLNGCTVGALPRIVIASTVNGEEKIDLRPPVGERASPVPLGERVPAATDLRAGWATVDFLPVAVAEVEATDFLATPVVDAALAGGETIRADP